MRDGQEHRVAVVGAGYFGQFHYGAWRRISGVDVVGIRDRNVARAQGRQAVFPDAAMFADAAEMLERCQPDLIDIVTPPESHLDLVARGAPRAYLDRQLYSQKMRRFLIHETAIHFIDTF